jgi:predicted RNA-binding protein YlxR (DUF448 family)
VRKGHVAVRTCLGCLKRRPKADLIRLEARPDGLKICTQGGRGLYVCPDASCLHMALKRKDMKKLMGACVPSQDAGDLVRAVLGQNNLDGTCLEGVICGERSGGGAVG